MSGELHHRCGRRDDMRGWTMTSAEIDEHAATAPQVDTWEDRDGKRACSYCGSMHPDDVFEAIARGDEIGTTDKNYKIYVGARGKFYFQHFNDEHKAKFVELFNTPDAIKYSGGFHFYVTPFFMRIGGK